MPPAARVGDPSAHPGTITGPGVSTVLIGGQRAAVLGDIHACAIAVHPAGPLIRGSATVLIGGRPAARVGDIAVCGAPVAQGMPTVIIGG